MKEFFNREEFGPFINGQFVIDSKKMTDHISITLKKPWKKLKKADKTDIDNALTASESKELENLSAYNRAYILHQIATLLYEYQQEFAECITLEMGKTLKDSIGEVLYAAQYFDWFAEEAKRIFGYTIPSRHKEKRIAVQYQPVGTVAIITPWNFPIAMAARKIAPAIAAGCNSIVKPSSTTPISLLAIAELAKRAGLPPKALSILPGDPEQIAKQLLSDFRVRKLTFTGSTDVGEKLYNQAIHKTIQNLVLGNAKANEICRS